MGKIAPRCKLNLTASYVSAQGFYFPCCWIGNEPYASELRRFVGEAAFSQLSISSLDIDKAWETEAMRILEGSWDHTGFEPCGFFCGKPVDDVTAAINVDRRDSNFSIDLRTKKIER